MLLLQILLCILLNIAVILLLRISSAEIKKLLSKNKIKLDKDYRQIKRERILPKRLNYLQKRKAEAIEVLKQGSSNMDYNSLMKLVVICGVIGFVIGLIFNNVAMSIILSIGLTYAPVQYLKFKQIGYVIALNDQIESGLNIISNSYIQNDDIIRAVRENIDRIDEPLKNILKDFLVDTKFIDANITKAILKMKAKVRNRFFDQWCDHVIMSQKDRDLKSTLIPIMEEMSDTKKMQAELDTMMFKIYKDYVSVVIVVIANIPIMRLINKSWYLFLVTTLPGKALMALTSIVILLTTAYVIKTNKPISLS
ncbi:hypothetical protein [Ruminiclostridium cellobioparum]|uniref:hypothetical protein n=1 Tax=Ruminiclostridium cellobioparum TaxID=29355 RepID=UPI0028B00218|nr:hypothetical protein [Ruminiclostridium cellobioparum]